MEQRDSGGEYVFDIQYINEVFLDPIPHDARHTHASLMLRAGIHPKIVQERLGHASVQITLDTYSHVTLGLQEEAAAQFDKLVSLKYNEREKEAIVKHF